MLAFLPIGSLVIACGWSDGLDRMVTNEPMVDPHVAEVLAGFATLFREYAIPVLVLTVTLAVLNVLATFAARTRKAGVLDGSASVPDEPTI